MLNQLTQDLSSSEFYYINDKTLVITKWDWDYPLAHQKQKDAVELLKIDKSLKVFIICSHPHCFTNGRGLQKKSGKVIEGLKEFDESIIDELPYPYYKIERGGGLTFHHPGQFIFYPIVNLTNKEFTLPQLMDWTLESLRSILNPYSENEVYIQLQEKAGLWRDHIKLASLGFALQRFITFHGLAFNLNYDEKMYQSLTRLNPCGLNAEVYGAFQVQENQVLSREKLYQDFIKQLEDTVSYRNN